MQNDPKLIVAQRILEGRSLSGFSQEAIVAGAVLHEHQQEVRASYLRIISQDETAPLPAATPMVRRILIAAREAEREGKNLLEVLPPDATADDIRSAASVELAIGHQCRQENHDLAALAAAVESYYQGETTLDEAYAAWEVAQRPEETPVTFYDEHAGRRLQSLMHRAWQSADNGHDDTKAACYITDVVRHQVLQDPVLTRHVLHIGTMELVRAYLGVCIDLDECIAAILADVAAKRGIPEPAPRIRAVFDMVHKKISGERLPRPDLAVDESELSAEDLVPAADFALAREIGPKSRELWTTMREMSLRS